jgi:hypothetical protein
MNQLDSTTAIVTPLNAMLRDNKPWQSAIA